MKSLTSMILVSVLSLASCIGPGGLLGPSIADLEQRFVTVELYFET